MFLLLGLLYFLHFHGRKYRWNAEPQEDLQSCNTDCKNESGSELCCCDECMSGRKFIWFSFLIFAPIWEEVSAIPFYTHKCIYTHTHTHTHAKQRYWREWFYYPTHLPERLLRFCFLLLAPPRRFNTLFVREHKHAVFYSSFMLKSLPIKLSFCNITNGKRISESATRLGQCLCVR